MGSAGQHVIDLAPDVFERLRRHALLQFFEKLALFLPDMSGKRFREPAHSLAIEPRRRRLRKILAQLLVLREQFVD